MKTNLTTSQYSGRAAALSSVFCSLMQQRKHGRGKNKHGLKNAHVGTHSCSLTHLTQLLYPFKKEMWPEAVFKTAGWSFTNAFQGEEKKKKKKKRWSTARQEQNLISIVLNKKIASTSKNKKLLNLQNRLWKCETKSTAQTIITLFITFTRCCLS